MHESPIIVWLRRDLRLDDNPALATAAATRRPVVPLYVHATDDAGGWSMGAASRWWLHHSLASLDASLHALGGRLVIRTGSSVEVVSELVARTGATTCLWNRRYDANSIDIDSAIKSVLIERGVEVRSFNGSLLYEPWEVKTKDEAPYRVFTPFWKAASKVRAPAAPIPAPASLADGTTGIVSESIDSLALLPSRDWADGFAERWTPGEQGAKDKLEHFAGPMFRGYKKTRNVPGEYGTSRLSPHLAFGELSPRRAWQVLAHRLGERAASNPHFDPYLRELGWREFGYHILYHFPDTPDVPLRKEFERFPWRFDADALRRWQRGQTGFPIVDAGMRELWATGWMHNRVRMIVASFLIKDLLVPWQEGARWFWDTLVDADLANNTLGWQWTAGSGYDSSPFVRVFNPMTQGERFDPDGDYVRRWVPELAGLSNKFIHRPWDAPPLDLEAAAIRLGDTYPLPIVDHAEARKRALDAYDVIRKSPK